MLLLAFLLLATPTAAPDTHVQLGLRLPVGFEVVEFANDALANDIYCMTIDPKGRIIVAGRGYIRILVDDNNDGRADRAIEFADSPKDGAMGLHWEGSSLYVTGDGGLRRFRDENGDGRADDPSELLRAMKTGGEHAAHAIRRGPDGWLYVLGGDGAGFDKSVATLPTSPIKDPIGGCVIRFPPDFKGSEIVAHGFRNAYDMDFNPDGELFTFDSDNERCVSLPWYEPTRFYHVISGGHHGWLAHQRATFFRLPPYFPDVVAPVATFGRGSPTACVCYRHAQFPKEYRGGFFLCDWTFGRIYYQPAQRTGGVRVGVRHTFMESTGENGFAPTAAVVEPKTGDLYVAIGGRGTRGAVYRIRHAAGFASGASRVVERLQPPRRTLSWNPERKTELMRQVWLPDALSRLNALLVIDRHAEHFTSEEIAEVIKPATRYFHHRECMTTARLMARLAPAERAKLLESLHHPRGRAIHYLAGSHNDWTGQLAAGINMLQYRYHSLHFCMTGIRLMQQALGELGSSDAKGKVWEGYALGRTNDIPADTKADILQACRDELPAEPNAVAREITRFLALAKDPSPEAVTRVARYLNPRTDPVDEIHFLAVLACLPAPRPSDRTRDIADALVSLDRKITERKLNRERNWPLRVAEIHAELVRKDPTLNAAILNRHDFGRADHVLFTQAPGFDRERAARIFLGRAHKERDYDWSPELVKLLGSLLDGECFPVLRLQWEQLGLRDAILAVLTRKPAADDRGRFLEGLSSPQLDTVQRCVDALGQLPAAMAKQETLALVLALSRLPEGKESRELAEKLTALLRRASGANNLGAERAAWLAWFRRTHPELASRLDGPDDVDMPAWRKRLEKLDWSTGKAEPGVRIYQRLGCAVCHSGGSALGPDLKGVANRFARDDLFTAILQPSKDIPPRYHTVIIATHDGKVHSGAIIYEAVDGVMLQTNATTTVRIAGEQIATRRPSPRSLMPAGLLDKCADQEIADLYAYLRGLGK